MGQNNSQTQESRSVLLQNWMPHDSDINVFVNRSTHQHIQRHFMRILIKDLPRQIALISSRMNNPQPFICRLLYFHPVNSQNRKNNDPDKQSREIYIYTDRMLQLKDWSRQKITFIIKGLLKLMATYGPFRITQTMIRQNQSGEVKLWISENPVNNHPDFKYENQEHLVGDLAAILTRKNQDVVNVFFGCKSLKEVVEKLARSAKDKFTALNSHSHRASESGQIKNKKQQKNQFLTHTPYRNVFGDLKQGFKNKQGFLTPKNAPKSFDSCPQNLVQNREQNSKTISNLNNLNNFFAGSFKSEAADNKAVTKQNLKYKIPQQNSIQFRKKPSEEAESSSKYLKVPGMQNNRQENYVKNSQYLTQTTSSMKTPQPPKTFIFPHRFQTMANLPSNQNVQLSFISPKNTKTVYCCHSGQITPVLSPSNQQKQQMPKSSNFYQNTKEERGKNVDITIINNTVNNYISNITHHHHPTGSEKSTDECHQFRGQAKGNQNTNQYYPPSNGVKNKQKQFTIPNFIQQKKKSTYIGPEQISPPTAKSRSNNVLQRKDTIKSNPQQPQINQQCDPIPQKTIEHQHSQGAFKYQFVESRNNNKNYNFGRTNQMPVSPFKFGNNGFLNVPKTPPPTLGNYSNFSSFQKINNGSFDSKMPLRTKTTEFFPKSQFLLVKGQNSTQNKSFTQNELDKNQIELKLQAKIRKHTNKQPSICNHLSPQKTKKTITETMDTKPQQKEQPKTDFKKQLRNQFKNLLGADNSNNKPQEDKQVQTIASQPFIEEKIEVKEGKQQGVKEKIKRKQLVFAQLKKQAFKILTDD